MILSTTNNRVKMVAPRDRDFEMPHQLNKEIMKLVEYVQKNKGMISHRAYRLSLDEDFFTGFMNYDQMEQANDPWPFCKRAMWPEYLLGMPVKYVRNAGWNICLEIYGGEFITDTGTSEEPPYE